MHLLLILCLAFDLTAIRQEPNLERRSERAMDNASTAMDAARDASTAGELEKLYLKEQGLKRRSATIAYCRIGERSSHTWFVLKYLLGFQTRGAENKRTDAAPARLGAGGGCG